MAVINKNRMGMLMVVAVLAVICGGKQQCAMAAAAACDTQAQGLYSKCYSYVVKGTPQTPPSAECCQVVKTATFDCVCSYVTPITELLVDVNKVIYVAETCGLAVPHGQKCGSVTVP